MKKHIKQIIVKIDKKLHLEPFYTSSPPFLYTGTGSIIFNLDEATQLKLELKSPDVVVLPLEINYIEIGEDEETK